jgi:hypothetical protein
MYIMKLVFIVLMMSGTWEDFNLQPSPTSLFWFRVLYGKEKIFLYRYSRHVLGNGLVGLLEGVALVVLFFRTGA